MSRDIDERFLAALLHELGADLADPSVQQLLSGGLAESAIPPPETEANDARFTLPNMSLLNPKSLTEEQLQQIADHLHTTSSERQELDGDTRWA